MQEGKGDTIATAAIFLEKDTFNKTGYRHH